MPAGEASSLGAQILAHLMRRGLFRQLARIVSIACVEPEALAGAPSSAVPRPAVPAAEALATALVVRYMALQGTHNGKCGGRVVLLAGARVDEWKGSWRGGRLAEEAGAIVRGQSGSLPMLLATSRTLQFLLYLECRESDCYQAWICAQGTVNQPVDKATATPCWPCRTHQRPPLAAICWPLIRRPLRPATPPPLLSGHAVVCTRASAALPLAAAPGRAPMAPDRGSTAGTSFDSIPAHEWCHRLP
jgi:hypothetical protein